MKLCVYTICKNEINRIDKWLDCMKEADYMVIADTGSDDGTYEKLLKSKVVFPNLIVEKIQVYPWRFDNARNEAMKYIPKDTTICVSMDIDELFMGKGWSNVLKSIWKPNYELGTLLYLDNKENNIFNKRNIFPRTKIHTLKAFWKYPLHELLVTNKKDKFSGESLDLVNHLHIWEVSLTVKNLESLIVDHTSCDACKSSYIPLADLRYKEEQDIESIDIKVMELFRNKRYDECLEFIEEIKKIDYNKFETGQRIMSNSLIYFRKAYIYENYKKQYSLAIKFYEKSLEEGIINYESMYQLTKLYYSMNQKQKIIAMLQTYVENWRRLVYTKYSEKYNELDTFFKEEFTKYYNLCK